MNKNRYCFSYLPNGQGGFKIIKIEEDTKGYIEMHYKHYDSEDEIKSEVEQMNRDFYGLTGMQVVAIELSSL